METREEEKMRQSAENFNLLMAMEYGYEQSEKGHNIQMAKSNFIKMLNGEPSN